MDPQKPGFGGAAPNADNPRPATRPPAAPSPVDSPGKTRDFLQSAPKLEIPKGGGAIRRKMAGNGCTYTYLKRILYGNVPGDEEGWLFEVVFDYGDHSGDPDAESPTAPAATPDQTWPVRADIHSSFKSGFDVRCYRLCSRVLVFHRFDDPTGASSVLVRSTEFTYAPSAIATTLSSVTQRGWKYDDIWTTQTMPVLEFSYIKPLIRLCLPPWLLRQFGAGVPWIREGGAVGYRGDWSLRSAF